MADLDIDAGYPGPETFGDSETAGGEFDVDVCNAVAELAAAAANDTFDPDTIAKRVPGDDVIAALPSEVQTDVRAMAGKIREFVDDYANDQFDPRFVEADFRANYIATPAVVDFFNSECADVVGFEIGSSGRLPR